MSTGFTPEEQWSVRMLSQGNSGMIGVLEDVARKQANSRALHHRAQASLSGLQSQLPYLAPLFPVCVQRAKGARFVDVDGREFVDCHMAYTASILGHNPPSVLAAFQAAMDRGVGGGHFVQEHVELGELIREMVPGAQRVAYFHTGGEAVEAAVRLARAATGRRKVAKFEGCYHGSHDLGLHNTMMALSGVPPEGDPAAIPPVAATAGVIGRGSEELLVLPFNSPVAFELLRAHAGELACIVTDPVPPFLTPWLEDCHQFLGELRGVATELGVPLIFDEVVCGFRLARGGAREWSGQWPELSCFGKITSGLGIPLSVVAGDAHLMDRARTDGIFRDYPSRKAWLSSTLGGNFPAVAAALAQLRHLEDHYGEITATLDRNHQELKERLARVAQESGIPVGLHGHPRLQMQLSIGKEEPGERTYRGVMASTSPAHFRALLALTFYLRQRGVYVKMIPSMNLSAAHGSQEMEFIAEAVGDSVRQMDLDGMLPGT